MQSLGQMNPKLSVMTEGAAENMRQWQKIVDVKNCNGEIISEDPATT